MPYNFEHVVDSIDAVPEDYRPAYNDTANADGKFEIKPEFKSFATAVAGNITALGKSRTDLAKANKESADRRGALKAFEDLLTASGVTVEDGKSATDALKAHIDNLTATAKNGGELKVNLERMKSDFEKQAKVIKDESDAKVGKMNKTLERHLIGDVAKSSLTAKKGSHDLLMPVVERNVKVVEDGDDYTVRVIDPADGSYRMNTKGVFMSVDELVDELKKNPSYARAFESETKSGSGAHQQTRQTQAQTARSSGDKLSSTDKIAAGLRKGQVEHTRS